VYVSQWLLVIIASSRAYSVPEEVRYATVMASVGAWWKRESKWGSGGVALNGVQGAKPLVKGPGAKPLEAGAYFTMNVRVLHAYFTYSVYFLKLKLKKLILKFI